MSFKDLGLTEKTIQAINDLGYEKPTTVQKDVIPSILSGKDVFTIAPAACGKTCSYIFPLIDIISHREGHNILIITPGSRESVNISDKFSIFNRYHEINDETLEASESEANVIIASPDLLLENIKEERIDISNINILVVDDINLIKKNHQLKKLNEILDMLPANKQNIIFTKHKLGGIFRNDATHRLVFFYRSSVSRKALYADLHLGLASVVDHVYAIRTVFKIDRRAHSP
jgi:superfamily II DNA/RNA helicase